MMLSELVAKLSAELIRDGDIKVAYIMQSFNTRDQRDSCIICLDNKWTGTAIQQVDIRREE